MIVDSHCHLDYSNLYNQLDDIIKRDEILQDWEFLQNRILADIANSYWGKNASYYILLHKDLQFQETYSNIKSL